MRYKLRIACAIALITILASFLYLYSTGRISESLFEYYNSEEYAPAQRIQSLWSNWSKIVHDARPRSERIRLLTNAHIINTPSDSHSPRQPPTNRIVNGGSDIESLRSSHASFLSQLRSAKIGADIYSGKGIVVVGGGEYFGPAIIGLHMLRKANCTVPVEIFVADHAEYEPVLCEEYLPKYNARCLILSDFLEDGGNGTSTFQVTRYQLKALAMLFSSFAEILYLDSDSIPLVNPSTELFETEPYISSGLVIWPDFWIATESPIFYTIAGLPYFPSDLPMSSSESGQVLLNKKTHLRTLLLAVYYNVYGPDYYYPLLSQGVLGQGDKETFMAAALVLGEEFYRVKTGVASVGRHTGRVHKGSAMIQFHPTDDFFRFEVQESNSTDGKNMVVHPAFIHANTPKMNAGHLLDEGDLLATDKTRLRLWGSKTEQESLFGYDLEKVVWEILLDTGCELEPILGEWKGRERICGRLEDHWKEVF